MNAGLNDRSKCTRMFQEAAEASGAVARQIEENAPIVEALVAKLRRSRPTCVVTFARGSSDNAATYARYLIETRLGVLTASAPPSTSSVYKAKMQMRGALCLAISQSGRSPDLLAAVRAATDGGGTVVALVNDEGSPLASLSEFVLPLKAGPELSVAATKSYIASLAAILNLVALWTDSADLTCAMAALPELLAKAWAQDWTAAVRNLVGVKSMYVVGRGLGLSTAQEAALKFKETCGIHAEAISAAEVRHGPIALVGQDFPVFVFAQDDETAGGLEELATSCLRQGARVFQAGGKIQDGALALPVLSAHSAVQPLTAIQSFYRLVDALAMARGFSPDRPPHLHKVTETM